MHKHLFCILFSLIFSLFFTVTQGKDTNGEAVNTIGGEELIKRAAELFETNTDEAEAYSIKVLELGIKEKNESLTSKAYYQLVRISFKRCLYEKAIEYAKLAETGFKKSNNLYELANLYHTWATGLLHMGDNDQFDYYSDLSIDLARKTNNYTALVRQLYTRATKAYQNDEIYLALDNLNEVLILAEKQPELETTKAFSYSLLCNIYNDLNDKEQCKKHLLKGTSLFEKFGMNDHLTLCYSNLSALYLDNFLDSAYYFAQKALQAQQKSKIEHSITIVSFAFFSYFDKIKNYDSAAYYINKSIQIAERYNHTKSVVIYVNEYFRICAGLYFAELVEYACFKASIRPYQAHKKRNLVVLV